ncbi:MAG: helix-turn-helix transcriptional regulator [Bacteroidota bacterium]
MRKYLKPKAAYRMRIGQHIRMWRDLKGIKQHELAGKIGITPAALSQIENDIAQLTLHRMEDIADALGLKPEELFAGPNHLSAIEHGTMNKDLLNRIVVLMENMNNYFSAKTK